MTVNWNEVEKILDDSKPDQGTSPRFQEGAADFFKPLDGPRFPDDPEYMRGWNDSKGYVAYLDEMWADMQASASDDTRW